MIGTTDISSTGTYDFTITEDIALTVNTEFVGISTPGNEEVVEEIQVKERDGVILNDPTVTLPAEESVT